MGQLGKHDQPNARYEWLPTELWATRRSKGRAVAKAALLGVVMFGVGLIGAATAVVYSEGVVQRVEVEGMTAPGDLDGDGNVDVNELTDVLHVLVVGSDSRDGLTTEQVQELGVGGDGGLNTDTIMLLRLDPKEERIAVLSFPRDLLVTRCDGTKGRINAAYAVGEWGDVGGETCLVETVTELTGIPIHHYVSVNFGGFVDLVDALGGVTMYLEEPLRDRRAHLDVGPGCVTLDAADALGFVRARDLDSDFGRIARQQRLLREVAREITSRDTLLNAPKLYSLVEAASRTVETDQDLTLNQMRRIAFSLRNVSPENLDTRTVPGDLARYNGASVVRADEAVAEELFAAFKAGTLLPGEDPGDGPDSPEPGPAPDAPGLPADLPAVVVLNGVGLDGLARQAAEYLNDHGADIVDTDNFVHFGVAATKVLHPPGQGEAAQALAALLDAEVGQHDRDELTVVVGRTFAEDPPDEVRVAEALDEGPVAGPEERSEGTGTTTPSPPTNGESSSDYVAASIPDVEC